MKRVALLIETSRSYGRALMRGVKQYSVEHGPWSLFVEVRDLESRPPPWLASWDGDGILTRTGSDAIARAVHRSGVPAVELRSPRRGSDFPFVGVDNQAVSAMVADHLIERGFRNFGVYSIEAETFFVERRDAFIEVLARQGFTCDEHRQTGVSERTRQWERQQQELIAWIEQLSKPCGVLACTDQLGCWLLDACWRSGIQVPGRIAVVGVENDESISTMSTPPLSSVRLAGERIGYEAAKILDAMMRGRTAPTKPQLIPPIGIETRMSSETVAIDDPALSRAITLIRERACSGMNVSELLGELPISRSSLERHFRDALGRTPNDEITRIRIERVCELLRQTDLTLQAISERTGFNTPQYMIEVFRKSTGTTPGAYRKRSMIR